MNITDAKVLITGGTAGIGLATARLLVAQGAQVAICGRDNAKLKAAADEIYCLPIRCDVGSESDVAAMVAKVIEEFNGYNVLINNAGFGRFANLVDMTVKDMEDLYRTNVFGAMVVARESARYFVERRYGNILNVGSTAGDKGFGGGSAYASSKAALKSLTECWRDELRKHNVRVVLIKPSEVITEFAKTAGFPQEDKPSKLHSDDIAYAILHALQQPDVGFVPEYPVWATNPNG